MKKILIALLLALPILSRGELSTASTAYDMSYSIPLTSVNAMVAGLVAAGKFDQHGRDTHVPWLLSTNHNGRITAASIQFHPNDNNHKIKLSLSMRVRVQFHVAWWSWTSTNTHTILIDMTQAVVTDSKGGKALEVCPVDIPDGSYTTWFPNLEAEIVGIIDKSLEAGAGCLFISSLGSIFPDIPPNRIQSGLVTTVQSDKLVLSMKLNEYSLEMVDPSARRVNTPVFSSGHKVDYDGDGKTDFSTKVSGPYGGFNIDLSSNGFGSRDIAVINSEIYGHLSTSMAAPGDYDGDGLTDLAVKHVDGNWGIDFAGDGFGKRHMNRTYFYPTWGSADCIPVAADYDGDGKTDIAVSCKSGTNGTWQIDYSGNGFGSIDVNKSRAYGSAFLPAPADYDGDARADIAVFTQGGNGSYKIDYANGGFGTGSSWDVSVTMGGPGGGADFKPLPGDYDGDGIADIGIVGPKDPPGTNPPSTVNYSLAMDFASGGFGAIDQWMYQGWRWESSVYAGDFDGNGLMNIAWMIEPSGEPNGIWTTTWEGLNIAGFLYPEDAINYEVHPAYIQEMAPAGFQIPLTWEFSTPPSPAPTLVPPSPNSIARSPASRLDYDGDGVADLSALAGYGQWRMDFSSNGFDPYGTPDQAPTLYGNEYMQAANGDYDGDGKTDLAVRQWGEWSIDFASNGFTGSVFDTTIYTTLPSDDYCKPVPGDYDGDGVTDLSVVCYLSVGYHPWYVDYSSNGFGTNDHGFGGDDFYIVGLHPIPADYNGDGKTDMAFKSDQGFIAIKYSGTGGWWDEYLPGWGNEAYVAAPADYDGDGKADLAVMNSDGYATWHIDLAANGFTQNGTDVYSNADESHTPFGTLVVHPVPADYDGDGKADIAGKFDAGESWHIDYSHNGLGGQDVYFTGWGDAYTKALKKPVAKEPALMNGRGFVSFVFDLEKAARGSVTVFGLDGKKVASLFEGGLQEGSNKLTWTRGDLSHKGLKRGVYLLKLEAGGYMTTKRLMLTD